MNDNSNDISFQEEMFDDELVNENDLLNQIESQSSFEMEKPGETAVRIVEPFQSGWRLDLFLTHHFPQYSRVFLRKAIQNGNVWVDDSRAKPAFRLKSGQRVSFTLQELPKESPIPENIPLDILYEDDELAVVNKPPNMVVHPSRGHWDGTLVGALAFRFAGQLSSVRGPARPGIVHRLDRDTSGAILVAKNDICHAKLAALFEKKEIQKEYFAIVLGCPNVDRDIVDLPIGHHPKINEKMVIAKNDPDAKQAQTYFEVLERFRGFSTIRALPRTGRTHQIRVHLTHYGCPILCDRLYGGRATITLGEIVGKFGLPAQPSNEQEQLLFENILLNRQALHALRLTFKHPETEKIITIEAPLPKDLTDTLDAIRKFRFNE